MKKKNKKEQEKNQFSSDNLYDEMEKFYDSSGEKGNTQYGVGGQNNFLHNAVQAESTVPVGAYNKKDKSKKNLHKN